MSHFQKLGGRDAVVGHTVWHNKDDWTVDEDGDGAVESQTVTAGGGNMCGVGMIRRRGSWLRPGSVDMRKVNCGRV